MMLRVVIAGLKARFARLLLSTFAVVLGVAFVTGSFVLAEAVTAGLRAEVAMATRGVDASVSSRRASLTPENLEAARQVAGVAAAEGRTSTTTPLLDAAGKATDAAATALPADKQLRPFDLAEGRYPQRSDELALEQRVAAKYTLGRQVRLLAQDGQARSFTLVGTFSRPGNNLGGAQVVLLPEALSAFGAGQDYSQIVVRAAPGVTQQKLVRALNQTLPGLTVETGSQTASRLLTETAPQSDDFTDFFTAFAVLALVVATMVIHNSFTILVAQRTRELALLRCIGAGRGQVLRSVLAEATAVGLIAAVIGLAGGLGIAALGQVVIGADAVYVPLTARTVAAAFAVGVLVTIVAALLPARAATRVAPVAALRSPGDGRDSVGRFRTVAAIGLGLAGVATAVLGVLIGA